MQNSCYRNKRQLANIHSRWKVYVVARRSRGNSSSTQPTDELTPNDLPWQVKRELPNFICCRMLLSIMVAEEVETRTEPKCTSAGL
jgi:hypothetical protein